MSVVSMKQLLEAGVHFGHQTRRWNPKMAPYIFAERNQIYIIDLSKTVKLINEAYDFVKEVVAEGKPILFVGTKKQAQESIKEEAIRAGEYFVNERWLGGMLTNYKTIETRIKRLFELEKMEENGTMELLTKKEKALLGIPVIGVVDTNCDPDEIDYVIPGNDDAIRAVKLLTSVIADAVVEAKQGAAGAEEAEAEEETADAE